MAQTNFTPISLYYSSTASAVPTAGNLVAGELALNNLDGKLFYKDSAGVVQVIGTKGGVGSSTTTQVLYNSSGLVVGSANMTFDGTSLTVGGGLNATTNIYTSTGNFVLGTNDTYVGFAANNIKFNNSSDRFIVNTGSTERMRIDSSGNVGIGGTPTRLLDVFGAANINQILGGIQNSGGNFHMDSSSGGMYLNYFSGTFCFVGNGTSSGAGPITASAFNVSDRNEKENITYFSTGLDKILLLRPATFNFIGTTKTEAGLIAQDVQEVIPDMVGSFRRPDSEVDVLSLSNVGLFPYLVNAIQEQQAMIETLTTRLNALEGK